MHKLTQRIQNAKAAGRLALIPFVTAGFPNRSQFSSILDDLEKGGADVIEVGVPFSDPVADGPVVEEASRQALEQGVTLKWILDSLIQRAEERKAQGNQEAKAGLVLMGYYNPFLQYGLAPLIEDALQAGVDGFIVPDLPLEEATEFRTLLQAAGMALIPLVGSNTTEERMREYAAVSKGYVYVVSVLGTTGERNTFPPELEDTLDRAKRAFGGEHPLPIALGFGLSKPEQLKDIKNKPDGVVFGSALLRHLEQGGKASDFLKIWQ